MFRTALFGCLLMLVAGVAQAQGYKIGALEIGHPWSRATPKGATVAVGYLKITNTGTTPDRLVGASAPTAGSVEIHEMAMTGGVMTMRPLKDGLEIKPGQTVELKPGSFHLMLLDLKEPLVRGQRVKGTLTFEKAGSVDVEYAVEPIGGTPKGMSEGHSEHMDH
jgi:copper(I)-binding protein